MEHISRSVELLLVSELINSNVLWFLQILNVSLFLLIFIFIFKPYSKSFLPHWTVLLPFILIGSGLKIYIILEPVTATKWICCSEWLRPLFLNNLLQAWCYHYDWLRINRPRNKLPAGVGINSLCYIAAIH